MPLSAPTNFANAVAGASTTVAATLPSNATAGNTLLVFVTGYDTGDWGAGAIAQTAGTATLGSWTRHTHVTGGTHLFNGVYSAPITGSGSLTVTATATVASQYPAITVVEQPGGAVAYDAGNFGTGTTNTYNTNSASNTTTDGVGYATGTYDSLLSGTPTVDGAWTILTSDTDPNFATMVVAYQLFTSTGSRSATFTWVTPVLYLAEIALFKATATPPATRKAIMTTMRGRW